MESMEKVFVPLEVTGVDKVKNLCSKMDKKIAEMIQLADEIKSAALEITVREQQAVSQTDSDSADTQPCRNEQ